MKALLTALTIMLVISCSLANGDPLKVKAPSLLLNQYAADDEPGIQYTVVNENATVFIQSVGLSNVDNENALDASQTIAAFSMTKTLTAILCYN